jgi:hypothetical protein
MSSGEDRIRGFKFPQENALAMSPQHENESDKRFAVRSYLHNRYMEDNSREDNYEDMNPHGFWECRYSVGGISYNYADKDNLNKYLSEDPKSMTAVKIVSQGLLSSDPRFLSKIIYLIRHPRQVAKSQERLKRGPQVQNANGEYQNMFDDVKIHDPSMYIEVTAHAAKFFLDNPDIPVLFVNFDDLIGRPDIVVPQIGEFLGEDEESISRATKVIEPKLHRSHPQEISHDLWEEAETVYELFNDKKYEEILTYMSDPYRKFNRSKGAWLCPRLGRAVNEKECKVCKGSADVVENFKETAERRGIDWRNEPCTFECGMDLDSDYHLTVEESIFYSHWK